MSRRRNQVPTYKKHPGRDEARSWVGGRWIGLGKWNSEESQREYERLCARVREANANGKNIDPKHVETVDTVILAFLKFATTHYRDASGKTTTELRLYVDVSKPLSNLYGDTPAAEFGPLALKAVRQVMIDSGWCRSFINKQVSRIRRLFKWAASEELVPSAVPQGLACVQGLQRGRTTARESEPVKPVPSEVIDALLPTLPPTLRAMIELQRLTGMRPGEVRLLRPCDIERTGNVWIYRPPMHKTLHHEKDRVVPFGPKASVVLAPWLARTESEARCFTPFNAKNERYATLRTHRVSKVPPSQANRRKALEELQKRAGDTFTDHGYAGMVRRAAVRAGLPGFHPHQLRHTYATEVRKQFGLEAAQVMLGHSKADVTQLYAEKNLLLAAKVAGEIG